MQGLQAFRLPVMLQMCGGVLKRCQLRPFLVAVFRLRLIVGVFLFFVCVSFAGRQLFLEELTVMDSRWWLVFANCRADARMANMDESDGTRAPRCHSC